MVRKSIKSVSLERVVSKYPIPREPKPETAMKRLRWNLGLTRSRRRLVTVVLLVLYEALMLVLLVAALTPAEHTLREVLADPMKLMQVDEISIALTLSLFLPALLLNLKRLKIFEAEIEFAEELEERIQAVEHESLQRDYEYESALYSLAVAVGPQLASQRRPRERQAGKDELIPGSLDFVESWVVTRLMVQALRSAGVPVRAEPEKGSTLSTFFRLFTGAIDFQMGYSGTALRMAGVEPAPSDPDPKDAETERAHLNRVYERWGLRWLKPLGFETREALVMSAEIAAHFEIEGVCDLRRHAHELVFGGPIEYFLRSWAYPALKRRGLDFKYHQVVPLNDRLSGLIAGRFDVGVIWTTDPQYHDPRLKVLIPEDPSKRAKDVESFPELHVRQFAIPVCSREVEGALEPAFANLHIDHEEIRRLNRQASLKNEESVVRGVADRFWRRSLRRRMQ